jgi:hypothetical protein
MSQIEKTITRPSFALAGGKGGDGSNEKSSCVCFPLVKHGSFTFATAPSRNPMLHEPYWFGKLRLRERSTQVTFQLITFII